MTWFGHCIGGLILVHVRSSGVVSLVTISLKMPKVRKQKSAMRSTTDANVTTQEKILVDRMTELGYVQFRYLSRVPGVGFDLLTRAKSLSISLTNRVAIHRMYHHI